MTRLILCCGRASGQDLSNVGHLLVSGSMRGRPYILVVMIEILCTSQKFEVLAHRSRDFSGCDTQSSRWSSRHCSSEQSVGQGRTGDHIHVGAC